MMIQNRERSCRSTLHQISTRYGRLQGIFVHGKFSFLSMQNWQAYIALNVGTFWADFVGKFCMLDAFWGRNL
jgi:hypothetical protein